MRHIFVSYSRKDSETVDHIGARLEQDGFEVWIDREDIKGGELWRKAIVEAIDHAYAFVLMLSPDSVESDNVRKEVDLAEGSDKELVPVLLAPVKLPAELRYQLAGIQWIEYYKNPEAKYGELVEVLQGYQQKLGTIQTPPTREVELVFSGLDLSNLSSEEKEQLEEKLLDLISDSTNTPRTDLNLVKMIAGSVHTFVNMPADAAYQLKTAALNRDSRLINFGIDALRLSGDRYFVLLKTGRIASLRSGRSRPWFISGLALIIALLLSFLFISVVLPQTGFFATPTPTVTSTFTPTPSRIPTSTNTSTPTPTKTFTPTSTNTPTPTSTPGLPSITGLAPITNCRLGPSKAYDIYSNLNEGQTTEIIAVNEERTWYLVKNPRPDFRYPCWISKGPAVQINGPLVDIPIVSVESVSDGGNPSVPPGCSPWWSCIDLSPYLLTAIGPDPVPPN